MQKATEIIITAGAVATAVLTVFSIVKSVYSYVQKRQENARKLEEQNTVQEQDIARLKEENTLICYGLIAALDGLEQLGANHIVPVAKNKLEKYINQQAHK
ncbi:MAG: hypothetical protein ACI4IL_01930 [Eubacterium sp.]